jgi:tetratricopeptide (TPR) repeat protein
LDRKSFDDIAVEFQIRLYETALQLGRDEVQIVAELAELYTKAGQYEDGLALDENLVRREPENPIFRYNLACSLALVGDAGRAFEALEAALNLGFRDFKLMLEDRDLESLRSDARWTKLLARIGEG